MKDKPEEVEKIKDKVKEEDIITLLYSTRDEKHNNDVVLEDFFGRMIGEKKET